MQMSGKVAVVTGAARGLGRAYELFGDKLPAILEELNMRLAA